MRSLIGVARRLRRESEDYFSLSLFSCYADDGLIVLQMGSRRREDARAVV